MLFNVNTALFQNLRDLLRGVVAGQDDGSSQEWSLTECQIQILRSSGRVALRVSGFAIFLRVIDLSTSQLACLPMSPLSQILLSCVLGLNACLLCTTGAVYRSYSRNHDMAPLPHERHSSPETP